MGNSFRPGNTSVGNRTKPTPTPGPPFAPSSAENGLSVDPVSGAIVLGSGTGNPLDGQLLSDRVVIMNNFDLIFGIANTNERMLWLDPGGRAVYIGDSFGAFSSTYIAVDDSATEIYGTANNLFGFSDIAGNGFLNLQPTARNYKIGDIATIGTGVLLSMDDGQVRLGFAGGNTNQLVIDDAADELQISNGASTAAIRINGQPGVTGVFAAPFVSITVEGGIVTGII